MTLRKKACKNLYLLARSVRYGKDYNVSITAIDELRTPSYQYLKINDVDELMSLCEDEEKIVNYLWKENNSGRKRNSRTYSRGEASYGNQQYF